MANDPDHNSFNLLISLLSVTEIILLALAGFMSRAWRTRAPELWWMVTVWSAACAFLLSSLSLLLYRFLPEFRYVQLPLRWLLCLNVGFALLVTMASRRWFVRALACLAMLTVLAVLWHRVQPPWWDDAGDVAEMEDNQETGAGYEGIDEYVPTGADAYEIKKDARRASFDGNGSARIRITQWGPESKSFTANVSQPGQLLVKLFKYPAWVVEVNNRRVESGALEVNGQMTIPVEAGDNQIRITFIRTSDREIGGFISLGTGILLLGVIFFDRRTVRLSTP
jgi:hypothetical protein